MSIKILLATTFPAGRDLVDKVVSAPHDDDGRSDWTWLLLSNGDLMLGLFPQGDLYEEIQALVDEDYRKALALSNVRATEHGNGEDLLGSDGKLEEVLEAAQAAANAANGDSNDSEIEALRDALDAALSLLGRSMPEGEDPDDD